MATRGQYRATHLVEYMTAKELWLFFGALWVILCVANFSFAQDATAGLYVCSDAEGMNNIVTQAQLPTAKGQCKPYVKGMFSGHSDTNSSFQAQTPSAERQIAESNPLGSLGRRVPLTSPRTQLEKSPPINVVQADNEQSMTNFEQHNDGPSQVKASQETTLIYMCPKSNGTHEVIEAIKPPYPNCIVFDRKQTNQANTQTNAKVTVNGTASSSSPTDNKPTSASSAEIATLSTPPQDIYKCFDHIGRASYVGADERHKFKHCTFFSKSFAGAQEELKRKAAANYTLAELAAAGITNGLDSNATLKCTGAGKIEFNGEVKVYNCAARSFNYSPGSSGGSITLGDKQAVIAAHRLDYFDNEGSCGGTVLAENGRLLHLAPTKECPQAFKIEAKRIAKLVEKSLSIKVSGAFKERQQALASQINRIAAEVGVDPFLVHAVISAESAYKSTAVSHAGAQGLMQLMPATAQRFGVSNPFHTGQNIRGGTTYLRWLLKEFNGNLELAIAGYNAGEGNVRKYGYKIPPFIETRAYVPKVLEYYRRFRSNPAEVGL